MPRNTKRDEVSHPPPSSKTSALPTPPPYYDCNMDRPFNMDKRISAWIHMPICHILGLVGYYWIAVGTIPRAALLLVVLQGYIGNVGLAIGGHRLWSHGSFKARLPLQLLLVYCHTAAGQLNIFQWCRNHRLHHKYSDTYADPHTTRRGFFFSHMGYVFLKEHPLVKEMEANIPLSDLNEDPVLRWQTKLYWPLFTFSAFIVPMATFSYAFPGLGWIECLALSYAALLIPMHSIFSVNSIAHRWGYRPWDRCIEATDVPFLSYFIVGEGWHNYHHTFPWDYKSHDGGLPGFGINWGRLIIEFFAQIGWAYDLKTVSKELAMSRRRRTGIPEIKDNKTSSRSEPRPPKIPVMQDDHHSHSKEEEESTVWGWGDSTIPDELLKRTTISYPLQG